MANAGLMQKANMPRGRPATVANPGAASNCGQPRPGHARAAIHLHVLIVINPETNHEREPKNRLTIARRRYPSRCSPAKLTVEDVGHGQGAESQPL